MNPNPLACGAVREQLALLVGEDLEPRVADAVRAHLVDCFPCARELGAELAARRALLSARGDAALPLGDESAFFANLESAILARTAGEAPQPLAGRSRAFAARTRAALGMAALFLIGLGLVRWAQPVGPRLLGNDPLAVPARIGVPVFGSPEVLENLSQRRPLQVAPVPRFGLQARQDGGRWLEVATKRRHGPAPTGDSPRR